MTLLRVPEKLFAILSLFSRYPTSAFVELLHPSPSFLVACGVLGIFRLSKSIILFSSFHANPNRQAGSGKVHNLLRKRKLVVSTNDTSDSHHDEGSKSAHFGSFMRNYFVETMRKIGICVRNRYGCYSTISWSKSYKHVRIGLQ
jgi:hypothetical protein